MTIRRLFPIILLCFLAILAVAVAPDPDMWWHLRTGESILLHGLPQADTYSYTVPGTPWVASDGLRSTAGLATEWFMGLIRLEGGVGLRDGLFEVTLDVTREWWNIL